MPSLVEELPGERAVGGGQRDCPHHAHGSCLGRGGQPHEDRAQHEEDQPERRDHAAQALLQERPAVQGARLERQRRHILWPDQADDGDPDAEQADLDDARPDGAGVHVADRSPEHVGEHDEHQRRRDELGDGARSSDDAHRVPRGIAVLDHRRHRDHAHGDHRGGNGAGDGAENGTDEDHRVGHAAAYRAEQLPDRIEQVLGQAAALEDGAHEREERDRQQQVVGDDAEQLIGEVAEKVRRDEPQLDADEAEEQAGRRQRERRRIADQHEEDHAARTSAAPCCREQGSLRCSLQRLLVFEFDIDHMLERGDALDDLGDALQGHQGEADRQQQLDRPADQSAGIRGGLIARARTRRTTAT